MVSKSSTRSPLPKPARLSADKGAGEFREIVVFIDADLKTAGFMAFTARRKGGFLRCYPKS
jgi:hypothetical protein